MRYIKLILTYLLTYLHVLLWYSHTTSCSYESDVLAISLLTSVLYYQSGRESRKHPFHTPPLDACLA